MAKRLHDLAPLKHPEGVADLTHNIPDRYIYLLAPTAQLVGRRDFHPSLTGCLCSWLPVLRVRNGGYARKAG
jgi:hypothetical protein